MVGEDITEAVLGVNGNQVRLGIAAPKVVAVHREEIFERIRKEAEQTQKWSCVISLGQVMPTC